MENRIALLMEDSVERRIERNNEIHPIGKILEELFAQYQIEFPENKFAVLETVGDDA